MISSGCVTVSKIRSFFRAGIRYQAATSGLLLTLILAPGWAFADLDFRIPADAKIIDLTQFLNTGSRVRPSSANPDRDQLSLIQRYFDSVSKIRARLLGKAVPGSSWKDPDVVFYPSMGSDAELATTLFPGSTIYFGLDNHPFLALDSNPTDFGQVHKRGEDQSNLGFRHFLEIDRDRELGPKILGGLLDVVPGIRVRRVLAFRTAPDPGFENEMSHGLVEFDRGEGTEVQRFVQFQGKIPEEEANWEVLSRCYWFQQLEKTLPQALIVKASGEALLGGGVREELRSWFVKTLEARNGLLVQGLREKQPHEIRRSPYGLGTVLLEFSETLKTLHGRLLLDLKGILYGYKNQVIISGFGRCLGLFDGAGSSGPTSP